MFRLSKRFTIRFAVGLIICLLVAYKIIYPSAEFNGDIPQTYYYYNHSKYCVYYNYKRAEDLALLGSESNITLAIHSTVHYMHLLPSQVQTFDGFISYALYIDRGTFSLLRNLSAYWLCDKSARKRLSVQVVWEKSPFDDRCITPSQYQISHEECRKFNVKRSLPKWSSPIMLYPINVLRNAARRGANTKLHVVADIENIFSPNFTRKVETETKKMLNSTEKYVLVYRRFEIASKAKRPRNVGELRTLLRAFKAQTFHQKVFLRGHLIPELREWIQYSVTTSIVTSWPLNYIRKSWEPQFIMPYDAPYHFDQMPTRIYDHQVLVQELCRAGFTFRLLTHVFNTHSGMKTSMSNLEMAIKTSGRLRVHQAEQDFNKYLDLKYPNSKERCPKSY